jgi:predicted DNA binding CopG/RHH family protein
MTEKAEKIEGTVEAWESGQLGRDVQYAKLDDSLSIKDLEDALELKLISIRLKKSLISDLKLIADIEGMGYQPLIKQLLERFVIGEFKRYARECMTDKLKSLKSEEARPGERKIA